MSAVFSTQLKYFTNCWPLHIDSIYLRIPGHPAT
jgi:hypothetical protein